MAVMSPPSCFCLRIVVSMRQRCFQCWQVLFLPLFLIHIVCQRRLWDVMLYAWSYYYYYYYYYYLTHLRVFHTSVCRWFSTGVWVIVSLNSSSYFQVLQSRYQPFGDCTEHVNYNYILLLWEFFTPALAVGLLPEFPGLFLVFYPILIMSGWSPLAPLFPSLPVSLSIFWGFFWAHHRHLHVPLSF